MALLTISVPTLRQYVQSSSKTGYYIQANVGAGAPVTLQVSNLAGRIFTDNGYKDEDSVPTKLVWAMYDVGLVSTGGSGTSTKSADVYSAFTEHGVSSRLSDETRHKLIRYLEQYQGTQQRKVRKLRKTLDQTSQHGRSNSNSSVGASGLPLSYTDVLKNTWGYILDWFKR